MAGARSRHGGRLPWALAVAMLLCTWVAAQEAGDFLNAVSLGDGVRPSGIVPADDTNMYIATANGQLYLANIRTGDLTLLNRGGDGQALAGLCHDARNEGTLYAAGRDSGKLYAFDRNGVLQRIYQITPPSTPDQPHFIADCIQTRYKLLITDAYGDSYYWLDLIDSGPDAGTPSLPTNFSSPGVEVNMAGAFPAHEKGEDKFNAFGIEWTAKWNETGYIMNSATGELFAFNITSESSADMKKVEILGKRQFFPGAMGILFDFRNELIMYISIPHTNVISVLEFDDKNMYRAKYIRSLTSTLMDGPIMAGQYGNFLYPISGRFRLDSAERENASYSIVQMPRHVQTREVGETFTTKYDDTVEDPVEPDVPRGAVIEKIQIAPKKTGVAPEPPLLDKPAEPTPDPRSENIEKPKEDDRSSIFDGADSGGEDESKSDGRACFPGSALIQLENREFKRIEHAQIGDKVVVGFDSNSDPFYSEIFMFTHRDSAASSEFVSAQLSDGREIALSPGHYMHINGGLVSAGAVKAGDSIEGLGGAGVSTITRVTRVVDSGLYNPQTLEGNIVVNNVRVSTYTTAVHPVVATSMLAPVRVTQRCRQLSWLQGWLSHVLATGSPGVFVKSLQGKLSCL